MRKSLPTRFLVLALLPGAAWAQLFQNQDMFFSAGPAWSEATVIGGNVAVSGSTGFSYQLDYGYQIARASAASLLIDFSFIFAHPGAVNSPNISGSPSSSLNTVAPGLRFQVPVHSRVSFHAVADGGFGTFRTPSLNQGSAPLLSTRGTTHGVFIFGAGVDVRLSPRWSLRTEVRDIVTGAGLSGSAGRHHVLPMVGAALHF